MGSAPSYNKIALVQWYREGNAMYGKEGFRKNSQFFSPNDIPSRALLGKVVLVTGGNQGIGFEAAKTCAGLGAAEVHLLCRNPQRGEKAAADIRAFLEQQGAQPQPEGTEGGAAVKLTIVESHELDVSDFAAVRAFAARWNQGTPRPPIDVLINNAGCMPDERTTTKEGNEMIAATTYGGSMLLSGLLLPFMHRGSRIINVSSGGAYTVAPRPDDLNLTSAKYDGTMFYAFSKRHQIILTEIMAGVLQPQGILVHSMHPGWADTDAVRTAMPDFHKKQGSTLRTAAEGADTIVYLAASPAVEGQSGLFWFDRKAVTTDLAWGGTVSTPEVKRQVWNAVYDYVGGNIPGLQRLDVSPPSAS